MKVFNGAILVLGLLMNTQISAQVIFTDTFEQVDANAGAELLSAGAMALTDAQLEMEFRGQKFISLDGYFDWEFFENGIPDSFDLTNTGEDFLNLPWSIKNDKLCRTRGNFYPCVTVFKLGEEFWFSLDGRDGSDGLEPWVIRHID